MADHRSDGEHSNFNLHSALVACFKHKRLIMFCLAVGLAAAACVYFFYPVVYASEAKLLVRYILERSAVDPVESASTSARQQFESVVASEVEILTSWDLAMQVAESLGVKRVLPESNGKATVEEAARTISSGLQVAARKDSNIIIVVYKNRHPELATVILNELVNRYFIKHLEVHRSAGAFDFVSQQTDQVRARLNQTEDALKTLKNKAGVISLADSVTSISAERVHLDDQLRTAESELAEQQARVKQLEESGGASGLPAAKASPSASPGSSASPPPAAAIASSRETSEYQALVTNLAQLRQTQLEMSAKYTSSNVLVRMNQSHIDDLENQKRNLEKKYPELIGKGGTSSGGAEMDVSSERARLAGMRAKVEDLHQRRAALEERIKQIGDIGPQIASLERNKELEETNYKYFSGTLEKARVDEALDPSKMPNISAVQRPSPPGMVTRIRDKIALALAGGGLAAGVGLSLLSELILNRSFKRRSDLELQLHTPVMVSIPYHGSNGRQRLRWKNGEKNGKPDEEEGQPKVAPWDVGHFIRPYSEAIRDRLGLYFELHGVTHKPKLVGVTGFGEGAGASTLAAGVAAALSETGDGKVLLVDVNAATGDAHTFFDGRPTAALAAAIKPEASLPSAADNLYLATVNQPHAKVAQLGLKKFFALVPNLKASDFDYIIFDMPPLTQTSPTVGLAALMDKVLLVVEADKNNRDVVKRGYRELVGARADVAVVLNKTRSYGPDWLESGS